MRPGGWAAVGVVLAVILAGAVGLGVVACQQHVARGRRRFWCEKHRRSADHLELVREGLEREGVS